MDAMMTILKDGALLAIFWILWCAAHSILISNTVTAFFKTLLKKNYSFYRLGFNIFSIITIFPIVLYSFSLQSHPIWLWEGYFRIVQILFIITATALFVGSAMQYDLLELMGFRQIFSRTSSAKNETNSISEDGILALVRHPAYSATFLILWARDIDTVSLITNCILSGYLFIGTLLEEKKLLLEFGQSYQIYQRNVSILFPYKWIPPLWKRLVSQFLS